MKQERLLAVTLVMAGMVWVSSALAEGNDPLAAYVYNAPPNSWYAAKVKPKVDMQAKLRIAPSPPPAVKPPVVEKRDTPVAKRLDPPRALPFWGEVPAKK